MGQMGRGVPESCIAGAVMAAALVLGGCDGFLVKPTSTTTSTTGGTTGSYAYVTNPLSSSTSLGIYALGSGMLSQISGSPYALNYTPSALAVTPKNTYLYVGDPGASAIYAYNIGSAGALTTANSGAAVGVSINAAAMDISADGQWLFALDTNGTTLDEYQINASTGGLSQLASITYTGPSGTVVTPSSVKVSPTGQFVSIALGTAGVAIFPFTTSNGVVNAAYTLLPTGSATVGDYSVNFDKNNDLFVTQTSAIAVYTLSTNTSGSAVATQISGSPYATGTGPRSVTLTTDYAHIYTANQGSGTISGFTVGTGGALTAVTGSPFGSVTTPTSLGVDNSGKYLLAVGYNGSSGLTMYSVSSAGVLTSVSSVGTGTSTSVPANMALTH